MTRKRKNVVEEEEAEKKPEKSSGFSEYGYGNSDEQKRSFPEKRQRNDGGGFRNGNRGGGGGGAGGFRGGNRRNDFSAADFERQYGKVGGSDDQYKYEPKQEVDDNSYGYQQRNEDDNRKRAENGERGDFPKEIVGYLKNIDQVRKQEGKLEDFILDKCAEEVVGEEVTLLQWTEAAVVVESVFGSSAHGASLFLTSLSKLKHKKIVEMLFTGASARTMENLLYKMCPVEKSEYVELIWKFTELLCENWADSISTQSSAFLLRAILRISSGLCAKAGRDGEKLDRSLAKFKNNELKSELKKVYEKVAIMAFDVNLNKELLDNPISSLVIQEAIDTDFIWKGHRADDFVTKFLENDENGAILRASWTGKNVSRIWEKIMEHCREETRSIVWMGGIAGNVREMAEHSFANFPLQKLIGGVTSLELATDIIDEVSGIFGNILASGKIGVAVAVLKCASKHENSQEQMLKQLRLHFRASKASNKTHFLFNILTNNSYDGQNVDLQKFTVHGSILIGELLNFSKNKTLAACLDELTAEKVQEMSCHKIGSRVIQAVIKSPTLAQETKEKVFNSFGKENYGDLISDSYGSHVFEAIWDSIDVKKKQEIMKVLVGIYNTSKFWKFAMLRCDLRLFRQDRKAWVEKMKNWKKGI